MRNTGVASQNYIYLSDVGAKIPNGTELVFVFKKCAFPSTNGLIRSKKDFEVQREHAKGHRVITEV